MGGKHSKEYMQNYYAKNKDRLVAYAKDYYEVNKEEVSAKNRLYQVEHKEEIVAQRKVKYDENREEILADRKVYRDENKELIAVQKKVSHERNREKDLERSSNHYYANQEKYIAMAKIRYESDKPKHNEQSKAWAEANPEKRREIANESHRKSRSTPKGNLNSTISKRMNESLRKGMKSGRRWESLVNFTVDDLKSHLEKLFTPEMNWENYGSYWHVDHKLPIAFFSFDSPEDIEFKICWALDNLQPLEALKNMSKGGKVEKICPVLVMMGAR